MIDVTMFVLAGTMIRCITVLCVTRVIVELQNPWFAVLYLLAPILSSFGNPFAKETVEVHEDGEE